MSLENIVHKIEMLDIKELAPLFERCETQDDLDDLMDLLIKRINLTLSIHTIRVNRLQKTTPSVKGFKTEP